MRVKNKMLRKQPSAIFNDLSYNYIQYNEEGKIELQVCQYDEREETEEERELRKK